MLTVPQIEALRRTNPQLYEALKRLAGASLGPNQGWSLDDQITDGANYARVLSGALTSGQIDPTKSGVLMKGSVPPTWSGAFTYVSTTSSITWSWSGLTILRADRTACRSSPDRHFSDAANNSVIFVNARSACGLL